MKQKMLKYKIQLVNLKTIYLNILFNKKITYDFKDNNTKNSKDLTSMLGK